MFACLIDWLIDSPVDWLIDCSLIVCLLVWLIDSPIDWLIDWLFFDCLLDWLIVWKSVCGLNRNFTSVSCSNFILFVLCSKRKNLGSELYHFFHHGQQQQSVTYCGRRCFPRRIRWRRTIRPAAERDCLDTPDKRSFCGSNRSLGSAPKLRCHCHSGRNCRPDGRRCGPRRRTQHTRSDPSRTGPLPRPDWSLRPLRSPVDPALVSCVKAPMILRKIGQEMFKECQGHDWKINKNSQWNSSCFLANF